MCSGFYGMVSRMKHINRWSLMQCMREENLSEHSFEVSVIAHALAVIGNEYYKKTYDASKVALMGLFHDVSEVITGDMPTPIKYSTPEMTKLFHQVEDNAAMEILCMLPEKMRGAYNDLFFHTVNDQDYWYVVKAADKFSALIKANEELNRYGNKDFEDAYHTLLGSVIEICSDTNYPEFRYFFDEFFPSYGKTLDRLKKR